MAGLSLGMLSALIAIAGALPVSTLASEFLSVYHEHGFTRVGRASPLASHTLYIGLPLTNVAAVQAYHDDCSNPSSPNFQKWPSEDLLLSLTAPNPSLVSSVRAWVQSLGPHAVEEPVGNGAAMAVTASVTALEAAFQTQLYEFSHPTFGSVIRGGGSHVLPHAFQGADIAVSGIADMPAMHVRTFHVRSKNRPGTSSTGAKGWQGSWKTNNAGPKAAPSSTSSTVHSSTTKTSFATGNLTSTTSTQPSSSSKLAASSTVKLGTSATSAPSTTSTKSVSTGTTKSQSATTTKSSSTRIPPTSSATTRTTATTATTTATTAAAAPAESETTYPPQYASYQPYIVQTETTRQPTVTTGPSLPERLYYYLPGYDYIENIYYPFCPNGQPYWCGSGCGSLAYPTTIKAQVIPCSTILNHNENCAGNSIISETYTHDVAFVSAGGQCGCYSGLLGCAVKVPAAPNSLNQVCYRTVFSDGSISGPVCANPQATVTASTPQLMRDLYNIPQGITSSSNQKQAVLEFYGDGLGMYPPDLDAYLNFMGLGSASPPQIFSHSPYPPYHTDGEGSLDIQIMNAVSLGAQNVYLNAAPRAPFWYIWASIVGGHGKYSAQPLGKGRVPLPNVLSISWGEPENGVAYLQLSETWLMILTTRGTTILVSSGDRGYQSDSSACSKPDGEYPATSAFVTSVGATSLSNVGQPFCSYFTESCGGKPSEIVCSGCGSNVITSGGGYSRLIPAVPYMSPLQDVYAANVKAGKFFPSNLQFAPPVSPQLRGYPDVALLGANFPVVVNFSVYFYYGTSCSTPLMAGMVTLWNTILQPYNRTMGSMNRFLYQMAARFPQVFNDVVLGDTSCGIVEHDAADSPQCPTGWYATPGWDAATGLGSPNFGLLLKLLLDPTGTSLYA